MELYTTFNHSKYDFVRIDEIPLSNINKLNFALAKQPTETPDAYYKRQPEDEKPDIIINGGFYAMSTGATAFTFMDEGNMISNVDSYEGVMITGDKTLTLEANPKKAEKKGRDFMTAYPVLVKSGKKVPLTYATEVNYKARRTSIGWDKNYLWIVTVESPGLLLSPLSDIFVELGATYAINLDGGGSTRELVNGEPVTKQEYARPVDNFLCVYLKKEKKEEPKVEVAPAPKTIYRVQVGAFNYRSNAEALLAELKMRGFSDAFIKVVNTVYKVQIGAFSVKLNAERLLDRVTALGYKPFITTK